MPRTKSRLATLHRSNSEYVFSERDRYKTKLPPIYYEKNTYAFWIDDGEGGFTRMNEAAIKRELKMIGYKDSKEVAKSPLNFVLSQIMKQQKIGYAGALAGYKTGVYEMAGENILVTTSPRVITPRAGEFPTIDKLLKNMFGDEQLPYFLGWLKTAVEYFRNGILQHRQIVVIAGPPKSGKNRVQEWIITPLVGGRSVNPYQAMISRGQFNEEIFRAEHLMIADEDPYTQKSVRMALAAFTKKVTVNKEQFCQGKWKTGLTLFPNRWLTISCNLGEEDLLVIPPLEPSVKAKVNLFRIQRHPMPAPVRTVEERQAFEGNVAAELPMLLDYLLKWTIPPALVSDRYNVKTYQHPELLAALKWVSEESQFMQIIDSCIFAEKWGGLDGKRALWKGTAAELLSHLCDVQFGMKDQVNRLCPNAVKAGMLLRKAKSLYLDRIKEPKKIRGDWKWTIYAPDRITNGGEGGEG